MTLQIRNVPDWDDLKLLLEIGRSGSLSAAARRLGLDPSTVSRRIASLEATFRVRLFDRAGGRLLPTPVTEQVTVLAELAEAHVHEIAQLLAGADSEPVGTVRVAVAEPLDSALLVPALATFRQRHPGIVLQLSAGPQLANLARREADLALRFVKPEPSSALVARPLARLTHGLYARQAQVEGFVGGEGSAAAPDEADWVARHVPPGQVRLVVDRMEARLAAVREGLGAALLPDVLARREGLVRLPAEEPPACELWLVAHRELLPVPRIRAVWDFLLSLRDPYGSLRGSDRLATQSRSEPRG
jgi:DNA-binding transcriptional LysR family regulator